MMKKLWLILVVGALLASCAPQTKEEKVRSLVEPDLKACLVNPQAYEFAQIKLDSCFSDDPNYNPDAIKFSLQVAELYEKYKRYQSEAEEAESSMRLYDSSYFKVEHDKYKREKTIAEQKEQDAKSKILLLYKESKPVFRDVLTKRHEFTGWMATLRYKLSSANGMVEPSTMYYFLDKDMKKIISRFSEDDLMLLQSEEFEDFPYEFGKEIQRVMKQTIKK